MPWQTDIHSIESWQGSRAYEDTAEEQDCFGEQMELAPEMQACRVCCNHAVPQPEENADVAVIRCGSRGKCD